jgi:hypothetical protein
MCGKTTKFLKICVPKRTFVLGQEKLEKIKLNFFSVIENFCVVVHDSYVLEHLSPKIFGYWMWKWM